MLAVVETTKKKYGFPITDPVVTQSVGRGIALLFNDCDTRRE